MKFKVTVLITAIICFVVFMDCNHNRKMQGSKDFIKHTVGRVNLKDVISQTGEVQPVVKVELKSEASGKIEKVLVKEGQQLSKGDTIMVIDPKSLLTEKRKNSLSVRQAKLELELAKRDYQNAEKMLFTGTVPKKQVEDLKSRYESADIQYQLRALELEDVVDQLSKTVITAPMDGVITKLLVKEGEIAVSATSGFQGGTAIGTIADITNLEVITQIGEVDYIHLKQGQSVIIRPEAIEGIQTNGNISFLSMSAAKKEGEELGTFEVRVSIDSLIPGIAAGINVNVEFVIMEKNNVIGIPADYVIKEDSLSFVKTPATESGAESFVKKNVRLGATDYKNYEVISGINEGDVIILENSSATGPLPGIKNKKRNR